MSGEQTSDKYHACTALRCFVDHRALCYGDPSGVYLALWGFNPSTVTLNLGTKARRIDAGEQC